MPQTERAANFLHPWAKRPFMLIGGGEHPLYSSFAFMSGHGLENTLSSMDLDALSDFLPTIRHKISLHLDGHDHSVALEKRLLERCGHDEEKAFPFFMDLVKMLAVREGIIPDPALYDPASRSHDRLCST